jgi:hypothetical protein
LSYRISKDSTGFSDIIKGYEGLNIPNKESGFDDILKEMYNSYMKLFTLEQIQTNLKSENIEGNAAKIKQIDKSVHVCLIAYDELKKKFTDKLTGYLPKIESSHENPDEGAEMLRVTALKMSQYDISKIKKYPNLIGNNKEIAEEILKNRYNSFITDYQLDQDIKIGKAGQQILSLCSDYILHIIKSEKKLIDLLKHIDESGLCKILESIEDKNTKIATVNLAVWSYFQYAFFDRSNIKPSPVEKFKTEIEKINFFCQRRWEGTYSDKSCYGDLFPILQATKNPDIFKKDEQGNVIIDALKLCEFISFGKLINSSLKLEDYRVINPKIYQFIEVLNNQKITNDTFKNAVKVERGESVRIVLNREKISNLYAEGTPKNSGMNTAHILACCAGIDYMTTQEKTLKTKTSKKNDRKPLWNNIINNENVPNKYHQYDFDSLSLNQEIGHYGYENVLRGKEPSNAVKYAVITCAVMMTCVVSATTEVVLWASKIPLHMINLTRVALSLPVTLCYFMSKCASRDSTAEKLKDLHSQIVDVKGKILDIQNEVLAEARDSGTETESRKAELNAAIRRNDDEKLSNFNNNRIVEQTINTIQAKRDAKRDANSGGVSALDIQFADYMRQLLTEPAGKWFDCLAKLMCGRCYDKRDITTLNVYCQFLFEIFFCLPFPYIKNCWQRQGEIKKDLDKEGITVGCFQALKEAECSGFLWGPLADMRKVARFLNNTEIDKVDGKSEYYALLLNCMNNISDDQRRRTGCYPYQQCVDKTNSQLATQCFEDMTLGRFCQKETKKNASDEIPLPRTLKSSFYYQNKLLDENDESVESKKKYKGV